MATKPNAPQENPPRLESEIEQNKLNNGNQKDEGQKDCPDEASQNPPPPPAEQSDQNQQQNPPPQNQEPPKKPTPEKSPKTIQIKGAHGFFIGLASIFLLAILLINLKFIFLPMILAFLICCSLNPLAILFCRFHIPRLVSVILSLAVGLGVVWLMFTYIVASLTSFKDGFPAYKLRLEALLEKITSLAGNNFSFLSLDTLKAQLSSMTFEGLGGIGGFVSGFLNSIISFTGYLALTALFTIYFLPALPHLPEKLKRAFPGQRGEHLCQAVASLSEQVQKYLLAKTVLSALLGLAVTLICALFGVDFASSWGIFAFFLCFIPNLGVPLTVVPPFLVCLIQYGLSRSLWLLLTLIVVELIHGNWIETLVLGRSVNLSPTATLLAILLWGWLWGGVGMIIAVPLMSVIKFTCDSFQPLKPVGAIMAN
jgi:predicted PurR-regulated permease PerM